ncbi:MAG: ribbon-helix-helix protein, CopG family [Pseudonocardiaceae bacterium]
MAMTLRLDESDTEALREQADKEGRSMQVVAIAAVREYIAHRSGSEHAARVREASRRGADKYSDTLRRLGDA